MKILFSLLRTNVFLIKENRLIKNGIFTEIEIVSKCDRVKIFFRFLKIRSGMCREGHGHGLRGIAKPKDGFG